MRNLSPTEPDQRKIIFAIQQLIQGRNNATRSVTLAANATQTIITDDTINGDAFLFMTPRSPAAANVAWYVQSIAPGAITIGHPSQSVATPFHAIILGG